MALLLLACSCPTLANEGIHVSIPDIAVQPGDTLTADITITDTSLPFDGFALFIAFDNSVLDFLPAPLDSQVGSLMKETCNLPPFTHECVDSSSAGYLKISYVLDMEHCPSPATGPGVIYRLKFLAPDYDVMTHLDFYRNGRDTTRFVLDGLHVMPLVVSGGRVIVGDLSSIPSSRNAEILHVNAYPNPLNPATQLSFDLDRNADASLRIYSLRGHLVKTLVHQNLSDGPHSFIWRGCDDNGGRVAAGCYLACLRAGGRSAVCTLMLVK